MRERKKGVDLGGKRSRKDVEGTGGGKIAIRIYCIKN